MSSAHAAESSLVSRNIYNVRKLWPRKQDGMLYIVRILLYCDRNTCGVCLDSSGTIGSARSSSKAWPIHTSSPHRIVLVRRRRRTASSGVRRTRGVCLAQARAEVESCGVSGSVETAPHRTAPGVHVRCVAAHAKKILPRPLRCRAPGSRAPPPGRERARAARDPSASARSVYAGNSCAPSARRRASQKLAPDPDDWMRRGVHRRGSPSPSPRWVPDPDSSSRSEHGSIDLSLAHRTPFPSKRSDAMQPPAALPRAVSFVARPNDGRRVPSTLRLPARSAACLARAPVL